MCMNRGAGHHGGHRGGGIDEITIEILDNGLVKVTTNTFTPANHSSAEQMVRHIETLLGGEVQLNRNPARQVRTHANNHIHVAE